PRLGRRDWAGEVGARRAALVEEDQPDQSSQPLVELTAVRRLPRVDEIGDEVRYEEEIRVSLADHLVGDRDGAAPRVADVEAHAHEFPRLAAWPQPLWNASSSSPASGSRPATGSRFARPTPARSSAALRRPEPRRRSAQSMPPNRRCGSRFPRTSGPKSSFALQERLG